MSYLLRSSVAEETEPRWHTAALGFGIAMVFSVLLSNQWLPDSASVLTLLTGIHDPAALALMLSSAGVLLSFLTGVAIAFAWHREWTASALRAVALGAWMGPLTLLANGRALLLLLAALMLAPSLARLVRREEGPPEDRQMFELTPRGNPGLPILIAAAMALELVAVATWAERFVTAAVLTAGGVAAIVRRAKPANADQPRFIALLAGAVLMSFLGIIPLGGGAGAALRGAERQEQKPADNLGGDHDGLYLYPKLARSVTLVPPPPSLQSNTNSGAARDPHRVPFFGVYWVFRDPDHSPPAGSFRGEGDPIDIALRSMDRRSIRVEARQNFGRMIDLGCCSRIEVQVRNNDRHPGTIRMELLLRDTRTPDRPAISLGIHELQSTQRLRVHDDRPAVPETVPYTVPASATPFDEAIVRFHLNGLRHRQAAKVAVEAFVFVPRL